MLLGALRALNAIAAAKVAAEFSLMKAAAELAAECAADTIVGKRLVAPNDVVSDIFFASAA
jgi:hypothetical protein